MIIVPKCTLQKIQQLRFLIQSLLPKNSDDPTLIPSIDDFLDDEQPISLSALRHLSLENGSHTHTWTARAPVGTLSTGDFGRIPPGDDFAAFELLGNIFEEEDTAKALAVLSEVDGTQLFRSNTVTERKPAKPYFPAGSGALEGWVVIALIPTEQRFSTNSGGLLRFFLTPQSLSSWTDASVLFLSTMPGDFSFRIHFQSLKNMVSSHMSSFLVSQLHRLCVQCIFSVPYHYLCSHGE